MQRIRPAINALHRELGLEYALASQRLFTDRAEILYDSRVWAPAVHAWWHRTR
jgi:hypothetical protein